MDNHPGPPDNNPPLTQNTAVEDLPRPLLIVGLGASAGGLKSLEGFFDHMPPDSGLAFVVIQHLSPKHKSMMVGLLKRHTAMPVLAIEDNTTIDPNCVYLNPPQKDVAVFNQVLHLLEPMPIREIRLPIDVFLRSLAEDQGEKAVGIILSGTGSDGTLGIRAIKGAGGLTLAQAEQQAEYANMPKSAIDTGLVDFALPVEAMPAELLRYGRHPYLAQPSTAAPEEDQFQNYLQKILLLIRSSLGHDFTHYKQTTIRRRIERRLAVHKIEEISTYYRYLQEQPQEVQTLFQELLISVTNFFRDPEAFQGLQDKIIPGILGRKGADAPVRVWVPGCATGEEAYSLAILWTEAMQDLRKHHTLQVFATDIDAVGIERARKGEYPESIAADVSARRLSRWFTKTDQRYVVKKEIRDPIIFALQNLAGDPPFSHLDLISCRNLLIYLGTELQQKIIALFHYVLNEDGYLLLGPSETIGNLADLFVPVDLKWKIYQRKPVQLSRPGEYPPLLAADLRPPAEAGLPLPGVRREPNVNELLKNLIVDYYAPPCVLINAAFDILAAQGPIDRYLALQPGEVSINILRMAPEGLRQRLTNLLHRAAATQEPVAASEAPFKQAGGVRKVKVSVRSVWKGKENLFVVFFEDQGVPVTRAKKKPGAKEDPAVIASLQQELQSNREYLQTTIEELETANEEMKSTNEELQSTNEELQSTNEELETAKEELQSTNEELITVNTELLNKIDELTGVNNDINNLLASTEIGTLFLDNELKIKRFTPRVTEVINLLPSDLGRPIQDFTLKTMDDNLYSTAQTVLATRQIHEQEVRTRDGQIFFRRILPYRTGEHAIGGVVITFVEITQQKLLEQQLTEQQLLEKSGRAAQIYADNIINTVREPFVILDSRLRVTSANRAFYQFFQVTPGETAGKLIYELGNRQWDMPRLRELLEQIIPQDNAWDDFEVKHDFPLIGVKKLVLKARRIHQEEGLPERILLAMEDLTGKQPVDGNSEDLVQKGANDGRV
jgi:two-component system CheB/CheR fusion protein